MEIDSIYLDTPDGHQLHLAHFKAQGKQPLLFIHGALESGTIFYSKNGKGLAPYLQAQGHPCYVLDTRGKGQSRPDLGRGSDFGHDEILNIDLPLIMEFIKKRHPGEKISLLSHSWGGVLVNTFLLLHPEYIKDAGPLIHLAVKRRVGVLNFHRLFYIDLMWLLVGTFFLWFKGFLPKNIMGPEGESKRGLKDSQHWVYSPWWRAIFNGEKKDFKKLAQIHQLPRALYLTGVKDHCLGHIKDVKRFVKESGHNMDDVYLLRKKNGNRLDYNHVNIVTSKLAPEDHFPQIVGFLSGPHSVSMPNKEKA